MYISVTVYIHIKKKQQLNALKSSLMMMYETRMVSNFFDDTKEYIKHITELPL